MFTSAWEICIFNQCLMPPCSHTVNSSSICDKSTNGQKDPFQLEKLHNVLWKSHTVDIGTRCLFLIYPPLYSALIRWWFYAARRKPAADIVCQNTVAKKLMTRRRNEARSLGETLGFSFGEKRGATERTWAAAHLIHAALQMQRDLVFFTPHPSGLKSVSVRTKQ